MTDTFDVNDLIMEAQAEVGEIMRELAQELAEPQAKRVLAMQWSQIPPEQKEAIRQADPERFNQLELYLTNGG